MRVADFLAIKIWGLLEGIQSIGNKLAFFLSCGKKCTLLENYFKGFFTFLFDFRDLLVWFPEPVLKRPSSACSGNTVAIKATCCSLHCIDPWTEDELSSARDNLETLRLWQRF